MIRWKQAQIHKQRRDRHDKLTALKMETLLNQRLLDILPMIQNGAEAKPKLEMLFKDTQEWSTTFEKDVMTVVMTGRDPRWEPPVPDAFVQKRVNLPELTKTILNVVCDSSKTSQEIQDVFEYAIQVIKIRQSLIEKEVVMEEEAMTKKITSETLKEGFNKTASLYL